MRNSAAALAEREGRRKLKALQIVFAKTWRFGPIAKTPEAVYSVGNWGKDSLPITNCKLPIV
jgi:hypothetical protein